jgi:prophage regulatory protein
VDLVGLTEIGRMLGVTRQRAHQLASEAGFPKPAATVASGRVWKRQDVERWARKVGRL